jgi:hypothetical protein
MRTMKLPPRKYLASQRHRILRVMARERFALRTGAPCGRLIARWRSAQRCSSTARGAGRRALRGSIRHLIKRSDKSDSTTLGDRHSALHGHTLAGRRRRGRSRRD